MTSSLGIAIEMLQRDKRELAAELAALRAELEAATARNIEKEKEIRRLKSKVMCRLCVNEVEIPELCPACKTACEVLDG